MAFAQEPCADLMAGLAPDARFQSGAIVVDKDLRRIAWVREGAIAPLDGGQACWPIALAPNADPGPKRRRGDRRTPEGWYTTSDKPWSQFYGAIAVHYPNADDAQVGQAAGLVTETEASAIRRADGAQTKPPQSTGLGGEILIHGGGAGSDWTLGCIAMENEDLDALRALLPAGAHTWVYIRH